MSDAAEHTRAHLLKRRADLAVKRAEALWAAMERRWADGEDPAAVTAEFTEACAEAERLLLEYSLAGETEEPDLPGTTQP